MTLPLQQIYFLTRHIARLHPEWHRLDSIGWLRAAVLGGNDGIASTASLVLGVAAIHATHNNILFTGAAGLVAGAMSMATGGYISVQSQAETEKQELELNLPSEHEELTSIYVSRGLAPSLASQVATQLMAHDALGAHARDELGITEALSVRPLQAAFASASSFAIGAALPLLVVLFTSEQYLIPVVSGTSLLFLVMLGG